MTRQELVARADRVQASLPVQDHTVLFYVDRVSPEILPDFPYVVIGSACGKARVVAYVAARNSTEAQTCVMGCFHEPYVESVEVGRLTIEMPSMHGMQMPIRRVGLFRRVWYYFFG